MAIPARPAGLLLLTLLLGQTPLPAQAKGPWSACRPDSLSTYNCASYYSGTMSLTSDLKVGKSTTTISIVATVTGGRVNCQVKENGKTPFEGTGMVAVEHEGTENSGGYTIQLWCPETAGKRPTRDTAPTMRTYDQEAADYGKLAGTDAHEHPDADAANGVTGTETIAWQLHR